MWYLTFLVTIVNSAYLLSTQSYLVYSKSHWYVFSGDVPAQDNKSFECCTDNTMPTVINLLHKPMATHYASSILFILDKLKPLQLRRSINIICSMCSFGMIRLLSHILCICISVYTNWMVMTNGLQANVLHMIRHTINWWMAWSSSMEDEACLIYS